MSTSVAAYKYWADDGTVYQVNLPTDFATVLGFALASGTEPYLSPAVQPRYASWIATIPQLFRQIVIPTQALFAALPPYLAISGNNYTLAGSKGETISAIAGGLIAVAAGPQGPQGPTGPQGPQGSPGVSAYNQITLGADQSIVAGGSYTFANWSSLAAGTYMFFANAEFLLGASNGRVAIDIATSSANIGTQETFAGAADWQAIGLAVIATLSSANSVSMYAQSSVASTLKRYGDTNNITPATWGGYLLLG